MKIICVTGAPGSDVNKVADIFAAAGVASAQALRQDPSLTMASWHQKVVAANGGQGEPRPVQQPGRFWEQLAANLFMENMHQPLWAWAESRSVWLLDFWLQFEPNLHFVLVYTSPQRALAEALAAEREHGADTATLMAAWEAHQKEILRFYHRNPQRAILVNAAECDVAPGALLDACAARWDMHLAPAAGQLPAPSPAAPLVGYLAEQLRQTYPNLQVLQHEVEASLQSLAPGQAAGIDAPDLIAAVDDYRQVRSAAARADVLAAQLATVSGQLTQAADAARDLAAQKSAHESTIAELKQVLNEQQAQAAAWKAANGEVRRESDLMLLQMHQLQEEMERSYLQNKELGEIKATKKRTIDELNKKLAQSELALGTLKKELDAAKANKAAEKEKADALAALATAKKELDAARQNIKRLEDGQRTAKEAQQENELLLVQLHQVQEELEHYFLEHKNAVKQNGEAALRWQRMLERNPDYCDYRSLELLSNDKGGQRTSWRFTDLNAAGRAFAELRFDITVVDGVAAFAFARDGKEPAAPDALDTLTTADWMLLPTLCRVLDEVLQTPAASVARLDEEQRDTLREGFAGLMDEIENTPAALRFDQVILKREQVNPDYEHLWLHLGNLSLGEKRWSDFEFRLSCANVRPGKFGAHPKLEFPSDVGAVLFDSWYAESFDDFGDKLELRFALPEAMDMGVWENLSQDDREMMKALTAVLPRVLMQLDDSKTTLRRPLADWQQLAGAVQTILAARTQPAAPAPAPAMAPNALLQRQAAMAHDANGFQKGFI